MSLLQRIQLKIYRMLMMDVYYKSCLGGLGRNTYMGKPLFLTPASVFLGSSVYIWPGCRIEGVTQYEGVYFKPRIEIGDYASVQQNLHLTCAQSIYIGKNVAIAANVTITDIHHPYEDINLPIERQKIQVNAVYIADDCKIYNNAVILPGTRIGKHCTIGANSVVSGVFPDFCVVVGAPAKIIKRYCQESGQWKKTKPNGDFV